MPSVCDDHVGKVALLVQVAAVLPVVALLLAARLGAAACRPEPVQYRPSEPRWSVKVVLLALRPTPPLLSATLPLKLVGRRAGWNELPPAGVVTVAVVGSVLSRVKFTAVPVTVLPALSVAFACIV